MPTGQGTRSRNGCINCRLSKRGCPQPQANGPGCTECAKQRMICVPSNGKPVSRLPSGEPSDPELQLYQKFIHRWNAGRDGLDRSALEGLPIVMGLDGRLWLDIASHSQQHPMFPQGTLTPVSPAPSSSMSLCTSEATSPSPSFANFQEEGFANTPEQQVGSISTSQDTLPYPEYSQMMVLQPALYTGDSSATSQPYSHATGQNPGRPIWSPNSGNTFQWTQPDSSSIPTVGLSLYDEFGESLVYDMMGPSTSTAPPHAGVQHAYIPPASGPYDPAGLGVSYDISNSRTIIPNLNGGDFSQNMNANSLSSWSVESMTAQMAHGNVDMLPPPEAFSQISAASAFPPNSGESLHRGPYPTGSSFPCNDQFIGTRPEQPAASGQGATHFADPAQFDGPLSTQFVPRNFCPFNPQHSAAFNPPNDSLPVPRLVVPSNHPATMEVDEPSPLQTSTFMDALPKTHADNVHMLAGSPASANDMPLALSRRTSAVADSITNNNLTAVVSRVPHAIESSSPAPVHSPLRPPEDPNAWKEKHRRASGKLPSVLGPRDGEIKYWDGDGIRERARSLTHMRLIVTPEGSSVSGDAQQPSNHSH